MKKQLPKTACLLIVGFSLTNAFCKPVVAADGHPNVVVFLTDDQGWGDLSANGNSGLATPHVDSLARDGASFQNFYVCQVCAPTRAEFLTGRYHARTGVSGVSRGDGRLNADETTIADVFQSAGYQTAAFGKWHNGTQPPLHPLNRGFDQFYGFTSGHWGHYFSPPLDLNGKRVKGNGFVIDDFTDHALTFIEANRSRPFFCYLAYNTPHSPMMVPDKYYEKFDNKDPALRHRDPKREDIMMTRAALAMCENIDWNVGRVLSKLESLGLTEDTIVVYFSDNGPNSYRWNGGMKGRKGSLDEGGLRSPLFVRFPKRIKSGRQITTLSAAIDLLPTLTDLAAIERRSSKPLDGRSLAPLLTGDSKSQSVSAPLSSREIYSTKKSRKKSRPHGCEVSVRNQRFRLDSAGKLFDIQNDRGQLRDVSAKFPDIAADLKRKANKHAIEMGRAFAASSDRPFHVGFGKSTTLPARDGIEHGTIRRSAKPPNNSFFENWTSTDDFISWKIQVAEAADFTATVYYTCADGDQGAVVRLSALNGGSVQNTVTRVFDPPLYDKSKERVAKSHYFVKDFVPLKLGTLSLRQGVTELRIDAVTKVGKEVIDVHSIQLDRLP